MMVFGAGLLAAGCTDDRLETNLKGDRIYFSAVVENEWQPGSETRSAAPAPHRLPTARLEGAELYMVPRVEAPTEKGKTRGAAVTADNLENFGVFATLDPAGTQTAFYMENVEVTQASGWSPAEEFLWPGTGGLRFVAYSPYCDATSTEGITAPPARNSEGNLTLNYTIPQEVESQTDLLLAAPVTASASPCNLTFSHALTGVRFAAGKELSPCTVKSIAISGVASGGTLSIEDASWTLSSTTGSYSIDPEQTLESASGSNYVAQGTAIGNTDQIFMLLPGSQPEEAKVEIVIDFNGTPTTLTGSISGHEWRAGETVVYNISATADNPELILELTDSEGNKVTSLETPYTGATDSFSVRSYYSDGKGGMDPVEWSATLLAADGSTLTAAPYWITSFTDSGTDETAGTLVTDLTNPTFQAMSSHTKALRDASDINTTSGQSPYNLASATGGSSVENTANTYVINAPGEYSLPLVYGNSIKGGATNSAAYISTLSQTTAHKKQALFHFINHLGNEISDPYIYNNSGCTPASAALVWEDRVGLIRNVRLSEDGKNLLFTVPAEAIRQGNAVVGVEDASGTTMWSWQLWVTDFRPGQTWDAVPGQDASGATRTYNLSPANLGRLYGGDVTDFPQQELTLRFTQKNVPAGMEPLTVDVPVVQTAKTVTTDDSYTYYQWGRKDPMGSGLSVHYNTAHQEISGKTLPTMAFGTTHLANIEATIKNPGTFATASEAELKKLSPFYCNLWSINNAAASTSALQPDNVKTVYDPCPVGMKVPEGNSFHALSGLPTSYDSSTKEITITLSDGTKIVSPALGYRQYSGSLSGTDGVVQWWTAMAGGPTRAIYLPLDDKGTVRDLVIFDVTFGFSVRPMQE